MLDDNLTEENRAYIVGYLRGFFDGEGSFDGHEIVLSSTDRRVLRRCQFYLGFLDIDSKLKGPYWHATGAKKPIYRLRIWSRDAIERFIEIIGFRESAKRIKVLEWLSGKQALYGIKKEPDEIDKLILRWREEGLTFAEIGRRLGRISRQAVHQRYNRTRGYFKEMIQALRALGMSDDEALAATRERLGCTGMSPEADE